MLKKTAATLGLLLAVALPFGCAQNDPDAPTPGGPSTANNITQVTALPDVLPADGRSESQLRLEHRHRNGQPLPGRNVAFYIIDVQTSGIPGLGGIQTRFCSNLSQIGAIRVGTDVTDENGVAYGIFVAGTGAVFGEIRDDVDPNIEEPHDECDCADERTITHQASQMWTIILGNVTDPVEYAGERQGQDETRIEQYGGSNVGCL